MREADESLVGRSIAGKFAVLEVLGKGAMGCVYKARQLSLDKIVALKVMHPGLAEDNTFAARFKREAKAASRLDHPNSIRVIDYGEEDGGLLFIAMEHVEGRSLLRLVQTERPISPARIAELLSQTLAALAVAHDLGIVHRDVKPENILVASTTSDDGHRIDVVKVCDFGIAKVADPRAYQTGPGTTGPLTRTGTLVGTPEYMSPEQGRGDPLDARSDLYSVGVILFQMLTGRVPFEAESAIGIILKHITDPPPDPASITPSADPRLSAVCLKAMSKSRDQRYPTAREMRAALRAAVDGAPLNVGASDATIRIPSSHAALSGTANTVTGLVAPDVRSARSFPDPTETLETSGTETDLRIPTTPRWKYAAAALVLLGIAGGGVLAARDRAAAGGADPSGTGSAGEPPLAVLEPKGAPFAPLAPLTYADGAARGPSHRGSLPPPVGPRPAPPGPVAPPASPPPAAPLPAPANAPSTSPAPAPPPAPDPAPAGPYVMGRAWIEIGMVSGEHVKDKDVHQSIATLRQDVGNCYRTALAAAQSHATGIGVVDFSFDERGQARSAVVTNVQFLPGMQSCVQQVVARTSVPPSALTEPGAGATASVQLLFRNGP